MRSFQFALRSDLVAESNKLEGYEWTSDQVREAVRLHQELLDAPVHHMLNSLRGDERLVEALGLYRAYELVDEWARTETRAREFEIRALHSIIMAGFHSAGKYKVAENEISGATHRPVPAGDTPEHMRSLAKWWSTGSGDAVLDAAVVHAWLTHIHPFDDGNGRLARLLANMALTQRRYPALVLRSESDRGEYLDALALSDGGDILPLYELFVRVLRRTVRDMSRPGYVRSIIEDQLLTSDQQRQKAWSVTLNRLQRSLLRQAARCGLVLEPQGSLDPSSFALLSELDSAGNGWFLKVLDGDRRSLGLIWFGFRSVELRTIFGRDETYNYPSLFFSDRAMSSSSIHPFVWRSRSGASRIPAEITLIPGQAAPCILRWDLDNEELSIEAAAKEVVDALASELLTSL